MAATPPDTGEVCETTAAAVLWSDVRLCLACLADLDRRQETPDTCVCLDCLRYAFGHREVRP
jgi:hypothetical protein